MCRHIIFGAYIQLGDADSAVNVLKQTTKVRSCHVTNAFKDEARAELIKQVVEKYKAETTNFQITEYAQRVLENPTADRLPIFPVDEQGEQSEE